MLIITYTGSSAAANRGLIYSASPRVVHGRMITVNIGPMVCAKKYSIVSISDTATFRISPLVLSIRQAGASFRMVLNKWIRMDARS